MVGFFKLASFFNLHSLIRFSALIIPALITIHCQAVLAQTPAPVYFQNFNDAVTGDNIPVVVNHPVKQCLAGSECYLPDANPPAGMDPVDNYSEDVYERPTKGAENADEYLGYVDITSSAVGYDANYLYYRINLFGLDIGGLTGFYVFEINFDAGPQGDLYVRSKAPTINNGTNWGVSNIRAYFDNDDNVGAPNPFLADGDNGTGNGYNQLVFDNGDNEFEGEPGGGNAIVSRIDPTDPTIVELAIKRVFLEGLNGGGSLIKASFRPFASDAELDENKFYLHDQDTRFKSESPHPWLQLAGAPALCPDSAFAELALTASEKSALNSGTNFDTGIFNPCYPDAKKFAFDSWGTLTQLAAGDQLQFAIDLGVDATVSQDPVYADGEYSYTITVDNLTSGTGSATGVTLQNTLPSGVVFVSATPAQGSCSESGGIVTCNLGSIANGNNLDVTIVVDAPSTPQTLSNSASVSANEDDTDLSNNSDTLEVDAVTPASLAVSKTVAVDDPNNDGLYAIPGNIMIYSFSIENQGGGPVDEGGIKLVDYLPESVTFYNDDFDPALPGTAPAILIEGAVPSSVVCCESGELTFSDDPHGTSSPVFDYTPSPGFDDQITFLKFEPSGSMAPAQGNDSASFELKFKVRIK